ncbi:uncharacterized protein LOC105186400 [Harpegnathos saltator]|uniref:uncharacterized protein LOC105186400 n=1 Tax=Harpegnathos saltator TaxID=610380 RepID=UPI0009489CA9|nr:uncharacterized protein LOC105186400 [Harpegnathos saltator]
METIPSFRNVFGMLLLFGYFLSRTETLNPESFQRKLIVLNKVLHYTYNKTPQMNVDATFGVTLTEANLAAALLHKNARYLESRFFNALKDIVALCDLTRRSLMSTVVPKNINEFLLQSALNNPNLWIKPIMWTNVFSRARFNSSLPLSYLETITSIWRGTPQETESDQCLAKIVRNSLNGRCRIPKICIQILTRNDDPMGYPLTHRLLIVQVAKAFGCQENKLVPFSHLVRVYCVKILQHLSNLEMWDFPNVASDLALEQIVLCGMEGYHEFVDKHYQDLILNWPHQSGCFFNELRFSEKRQISRRSSSITDFGCDSHTTGLGAASLAIFIRENIENPYGSPS